ncbi:bifunctional DNA primase/polymerase [Mycobacteroides abscessus]|uniref:bifunctional DNA primase/polymerase n=1 Tax=Mycobacteroides abscessus TaxID=36809 RepID=UPI0009286142|nr:bifunctional DNA primase/polymerase [Mycobacteroides abscessus]DAZ90310.1 TPA_asm: DNA primase/polymerase [Mycobacterium phage prophiFSQJ01-1]SII40533.1 RecA-family ATPase-like protein [Mycobacteroides abscessus subsp. abscessus]SIK14713.1 RecA-family ATPase-like protein [Mycobacteroides abscessus subsp. abscessus]SIN25062.1 RecA-family ATPase-like protein [Mycobacteroides abscessus subsp. abscessus]SLI51861.1 RecA-family ATPase-like protein [Mycobacteroides abscessus subsp. abscessus]
MTIGYFTSCAACGELLRIERDDQRIHDTCEEPLPSRADVLQMELRACVYMGDQQKLEAEIIAELDQIESRPPNLGLAAVTYATEYGWPVFPLLPGGKKPAIPKSAGGNGFKDATTDVERIKKFWTKNPTCNIGVPTGIHFDVIDVDPPNGMLSYLELVGDGLLPEVHGQARTPRGLFHLFIEPTGDGNSADMKPGIDYRGAGGYVVVAPSIVGEQRYRWAVKPSPKLKPVG